MNVDHETRRMGREAAGHLRAAQDQLDALHRDLGAPFASRPDETGDESLRQGGTAPLDEPPLHGREDPE